MITLKEITKEYFNDGKKFKAVDSVSLTINKGEIFGFIGYSGAGKSTLVRCINLLERPDKGDVLIDGVSMMSLKEKDLREQRKGIGMIFQHFNLMDSRTIEDNVILALQNSSLDKLEKIQRASYLLELVGIEGKKYAYPSQLSGGQKQRVAIARALANNPSILLCDEATSALDPQTTQTILDLLKKLNKELGLTIVMITHEMHVIKALCNRVAIMEQGLVKEVNTITSVFTKPEADITKEFVESTSNIRSIYNLIKENPESLNIIEGDRIVKLTFTQENTSQAILSSLAKKFDIDASILFANVEVVQSKIIGVMVVNLRGTQANMALDYLDSQNVSWEVL